MSKGFRLRAVFSVLAVGTASLAVAASAGAASGGSVSIEAQDACDPATFPAGLCARADSSGPRVTFAEVNAAIVKDGAHGAWRFTQSKVKVDPGEPVAAQMGRGGEVHTFTDVTATGFGLGCVPDINYAVFHTRDVSSLCDDVDPLSGQPIMLATALFPGRTIAADTSTRGTRLYQCLIHPWMTATVAVR
jgi:hypothetical protein